MSQCAAPHRHVQLHYDCEQASCFATRMREFPATADALVVRTDFSDESAWTRIQEEMERPVNGFRAYLSFLSDPACAGLTASEVTSVGLRGPYRTYLFVVDREALANPEHPILVVDLVDEPGRTFRVTPHETQGVENNLSISNMDFAEFADRVDADGVFRGFPDE